MYTANPHHGESSKSMDGAVSDPQGTISLAADVKFQIQKPSNLEHPNKKVG